MGKSDKKRAQKTIETQGRTAQNYLSGVQGEAGNLYNNLSNAYLGPQNTPQAGTAIPRGGFGMEQFNQMFPGETLTPEMLKAKEGELSKSGIKVLTNASGISGKIQLPDGQIIDVIQGAGAGVNKKQWLGPNGGGSGQGGILGQNLADYGNLMGQYQKWADTGGLSEQDKANLRQRAVSPIRSMYERGTQDLSRQKALQGGYAPGYTTALTRMNRNMGQGMSDATGNAEANITQMTQQGKQFGMGGMSGLYGATPGLANMFGNQVLGAAGNQTNLSGLQNQLGLGIMGRQIDQGGMAGFPWGKVLGGAASIAAAIPTGGASLAALPAVMNPKSSSYGGFLGGGVL